MIERQAATLFLSLAFLAPVELPWSWSRHEFGGKYRRLLVTDGADAKSLIRAIRGNVEELRAQHAEAFREFEGICSSHQDNIWNIQIAKP